MKIEEYYASKIQRDVNLKYCGYEECAPDFRMPPHTRSEYLIHYITQGRGTYICEGAAYPIRQGDLFIIYPSQLASYHTSPEDPLHFSWLALPVTVQIPSRSSWAFPGSLLFISCIHSIP